MFEGTCSSCSVALALCSWKCAFEFPVEFKWFFDFYFQAFHSVFILSRLRPLFPLCTFIYARCMHTFAHFVIVLFWFSRTNIPNVFWNVVLRLSMCVLGSKIVWSKSCYSSLHDSAFYCRFTNEYSLNIHCGSFQSDVDGCKFFSEINLKYTLTFDKQKKSNETTIKKLEEKSQQQINASASVFI